MYKLLVAGADGNKKQWVKTYNLSLSFCDKNNVGRNIHGLAMAPRGTTHVMGDLDSFEHCPSQQG